MNLLIKTFAGTLAIVPLTLILLTGFTSGANSTGDHGGIDMNRQVKYFHSWQNNDPNYELDGIDGPYLIDKMLIKVDQHNQLIKQPFKGNTIDVIVNNDDQDQFTVRLRKKHKSPPAKYDMPSKLIAISDIEGNFNAFASFLSANQVIDRDFNWIYGDGHLVLVGDFVDRGPNVMQTLWLIYELEAQAEAAGGQVHFILGNHEIMNINGNFDYALGKYHKLADMLGEYEEAWLNNRMLFSKKSELGRWLRSKNIIEQIGDYIFVHAGLAPDLGEVKLSLNIMNRTARANIDNDQLYFEPGPDPIANFVMGVKGPFWYRGAVMNYKYYDKITDEQLSSVLDNYRAKAMVIGHTVVADVSYGYDGKVIRIDIKHGRKKRSGKTKGILIKDGQEWKLDDLGNMTAIK